jgi:two-component system chemotaxis response regulator CheB
MIQVLVVDDSLFMRTLVSDMLNSDSGIKVAGTARDGREALKQIPKIRPDVITLDLMMPGLDGFSTLKRIMAEHPTPVVMLSAYSREDADITIKGLAAGAVGFVLKPSGELSLDIEKVKDRLLKEVKSAASVDARKIRSLIGKKPIRLKKKIMGRNKIVVMGASTGGPQTVEKIVSALPADFPVPIIIVQHMPSRFFTQGFATHLNHICEIAVKEAEHSEAFQPGKIYVMPAKEGAAELVPSIDETMRSLAKIYKENVLGIVLTGLGHDGVEGMRAIKEEGGKTIVQDESALIFGMPKAVMDAGFAEKVLSLDEIRDEIIKFVEK